MNVVVLLAVLTVFRVDPWCNKPFLPDADPAGGVVADTLSFAAAKGEIEAVSFVVNPDADYAKVDVVPSDLTGPGGARIPASAADVALVKVWFRPGGRWNTSWAGDLSKPTPVANLVLHDDALVRVDWEKKINYLRGESSGGTYYMDMGRNDLKTHFNNDCEPVRDAPKFVPFDLKKGFRQQYLVTWKVPKDAKPGDYAGALEIRQSDNQAIKQLSIRLTVYPFALPRPRTHYDTREPYVSFWMGSPSLEGLLSEGHRLDRAERKLRAIFRSMAEHNAINLSGVGALTTDSTDDYALRTLLIARQEGMCADPIINGMAFESKGGFVSGAGGRLRDREEAPEEYRKSLDAFRAKVKAQQAVLDKYLGHHRCYYQSADECKAETNRRSYGYWSIIHELGGLTWTDYAYSRLNGVFVDMNDVPATVDHAVAEDWHCYGAKAVTYAGTFTGPENPDVWRRIKGLRFWYADHDGQHEYNFFDGRGNRWNDFVRYDAYCQFGIVYWTIDGLVSTLAWEAMREALDDVRYFTLLRLRAEAALKSGDPAVRRLGREALVWQDGVDPEYVLDLDAFRRETAGRIEKLIAKTGPQPEDADTELPPPAVLPPDSRWQSVPKASAGAKAVFDYVKTCGPRYDLALAALEGLFKDASTERPDRVTAALQISALHSEMQERPAAVAVLEKALKTEDLTDVERGKLKLKLVSALMTDERFEERYTVRQLEAASAVAAEALKIPGVRAEDRAAAVRKVIRGYFAAAAYGKCAEYAEARLQDVRMPVADQIDIWVTVGEAYGRLEEWRKSLKAISEARRLHGQTKDRRFWERLLPSEAKAAEMEKDYVRAFTCWTDLIPIYDPTEQQYLISVATRNMTRLQPLAQKSGRIKTGSLNDDERIDSITLDE